MMYDVWAWASASLEGVSVNEKAEDNSFLHTQKKKLRTNLYNFNFLFFEDNSLLPTARLI